MKPERSELVMIEEKEQKADGTVFTQVMREVLGDLLECAVIKVVGFLTRLWAPKDGDQEGGGEKE